MSEISDKLSQVDSLQTENDISPELFGLINKLQKNYPFFSDMEDREVVHLLKLCSQQSFNKGDEIFKEGDSATIFFLVVSGEVGISIGQKEVARLKQGSVVGEMAMIEDALHTASATATEPSLLFSITRDILSTKMPEFANKATLSIARQLSHKLHEANRTIHNLQEQLETAEDVIRSAEGRRKPYRFSENTTMR